MRVKAILDNELLNWIEIEKDTITEVDDLLWDYLLRAYWDRWEKVEDDEVEDEKEDKDENDEVEDEKEEKKTAKKTK